jgi:SET domain-containing protein
MTTEKPTTSKFAVVKNSKIHGTGVFAKTDIPKDTKIIEYVGKKITKKQADILADKQMGRGEDKEIDEGHVYIFEVNKKHDLDGNVSWNTARFINHSCDPNCETEQDENDKIWIKSIKPIKKSEELTYNYGYDIDNWEDHPCKCGKENCVGFIVREDQWKKLERLKKKSKN